ncbi:MAG: Gfo/Idh/MocA family oxidoreductase [Candidatus Peribacteraceae bacterium]|nr:Gfo/Idh/MocA family oxidoreductase [Candidatus Peribacteraceae bacterium]
MSDRKIRVGIAGYGVCRFGASFGFQHHPNVEIAAVCDTSPERCAELAAACACKKLTYPWRKWSKISRWRLSSLVRTLPIMRDHAILCLNHGKHVACAVPAVFGSLEDADQLYETVKTTGLEYMMFKTSAYHAACYAMRTAYEAGAFGKIIYSEGQHYHYFPTPLASHGESRTGFPSMWYPTHSTAYYVAVTGQSFTEVSCQGVKGKIPQFQPDANRYQPVWD